MSGKLLKVGRATLPQETMVEIARSFSYKLNVGNYESRDFFQSMKATCPLADASDISERLHEFCRLQVMKSVEEYLAIQAIRNTKKGA